MDGWRKPLTHSSAMRTAVALVAALTVLGPGLCSQPEAMVAQGRIRGKLVTSPVTGKQFVAFLGVPYAAPPVGPLRFKDPQPTAPWSGVRDCSRDGAKCVQGVSGDEDCLFLNVYSPQGALESNGTDLQSVMVWIHGGSFSMGSGSSLVYGPDFLLDKQVVVVTLNYRLGPLGFLNLENSEIPGNMGLKDQAAALRWVQSNIRTFGGDPEKVTLFGSSAGAVSVHLQMLSLETTGLFQGVICQSGSALNPWAFSVTSRDRGELLVQLVGCNNSDSAAVVECLRAVPAQQLSTTVVVKNRGDIAFPPTLDGSFLTQTPLQSLLSGNYQRLPFLGGVTNKEGLLFIKLVEGNEEVMAAMNADMERFVPEDLGLAPGSAASRQVARSIKQFYFDWDPISGSNLDNYTDLMTDQHFVLGMLRGVRLQSAHAPQFLYQFALDGALRFLKPFVAGVDKEGVCHADDVGYLWYVGSNNYSLPASSSEMQMLHRVVDMWTNFAKTGDPTPYPADLSWRPLTLSDPAYMMLDQPSSLQTNLEQRRVGFWDMVYSTFRPST